MGEHPHLDATVAACVREIREVSRRGAAAPTDFVAMETSLHEMRLKKSAAALKIMARACALSAEAHCIAMRQTTAGVNDWQVGAETAYNFATHANGRAQIRERGGPNAS